MKSIFLYIILSFSLIHSSFCQLREVPGMKILFHGIVIDASSLSPIPNSQILINKTFALLGSTDGTFAFYVNRGDTVHFRHLGYKSTSMFVSDTLSGTDFVAGIYMQSDTLLIGEVVIVPRYINLKSEIMRTPKRIPSTFENARYNVAISAYQGRTTTGKLGDPEANYGYLHQKQKIDAQEKGGIPADQIAGIYPLMLLPAAYFLLHGTPERPAPYKQSLTDQEIDQIQKKYLESLKQQK